MHNRGWNRLVIVVCTAYCLFVISAIIHEHLSINPYDQFDSTRPFYTFWHWYPYLDAPSHQLMPNFSYISALVSG